MTGEKLAARIARTFGLMNPDVVEEYVAQVIRSREAGEETVTLHHGGAYMILNLRGQEIGP
jgi:hypothetical protein